MNFSRSCTQHMRPSTNYQTLHYSNEFNNFMVCFHKLSFHVIMSLFFSTPHNVLKMYHKVYLYPKEIF